VRLPYPSKQQRDLRNGNQLRRCAFCIPTPSSGSGTI
jgi:hypothetical protein